MPRSIEQKHSSWYSACYAYAEGIRHLTNGGVNNKRFYALVGSYASRVTSYERSTRKNAASSVSHAMHSSGYVQEIKDRVAAEPQLFANAAKALCEEIQRAKKFSCESAIAYVRQDLWHEILAGLENEVGDGRPDISLKKIESEWAHLTFLLDQDVGEAPGNESVCGLEETAGNATSSTPVEAASNETSCAFLEKACDDAASNTKCTQLELVLEQLFNFITFGCLDAQFAKALVDLTPTELLSESDVLTGEFKDANATQACLMKTDLDDASRIINMWTVSSNEAFVIGRYTSCSCIEMNKNVSRNHCQITYAGNAWFLTDLGSKAGSVVERDGVAVWDSTQEPPHSAFKLEYGDNIVLAKSVRYWFVAMQK
jgi:hypothetical protein